MDDETFAARIAFKRSELRRQQAGWRPLSGTSIEDLILEDADQMLADGDPVTILQHARWLQTALSLSEAGNFDESLNVLALVRLGASAHGNDQVLGPLASGAAMAVPQHRGPPARS